MTLRAIDTTDTVNTCDCCGKANLKLTVIMQDRDGDTFYYGRTCAAAAAGVKLKRNDDAVKGINDGLARQERRRAAETDAQKQADHTGEAHVVVKDSGNYRVMREAAWASKPVASPCVHTASPKAVAA